MKRLPRPPLDIRPRPFSRPVKLAAIGLAACVLAWQLPNAMADDGILSRLLGSGSSEKPDSRATHEFKRAVTVKTSDGNGVQTFCLDGQGRIVALAAPPRYFSGTSKNSPSEVHVLANDGEPITHWSVDFVGQSINAGPDGTIYVAGDAKIAKYGPDGKLIKELELPHIAELLKNTKRDPQTGRAAIGIDKAKVRSHPETISRAGQNARRQARKRTHAARQVQSRSEPPRTRKV